jgi:uncharacterized protein (TIGR00369 family)
MDEDSGAVAFAQEYIDEHHTFLSWLGLTVEEYRNGSIVMTVPYDEKLTNKPPHGDGSGAPYSMHGGVAATLIDTAGGLALRPSLDDSTAGGVATINLNVNYLRRATADLRAEAQVVRAGTSVGVSDVLVESDVPGDGRKPVAVGQGAYRLFQGREQD